MEETKSLLILRLEGMLQSWGEDAKWDYRGTGDMPTKSGIVGLLGCAMGLPRGSDALVELSRDLAVAVRADRPGVKFVDFQTVTGDPLMAASGKPKTTGNTILSPHGYLQDACFTVFLETTPVWHRRILEALENPRWCMHLGRKNCVPSRPVLECASPPYDGLMGAVKAYPPAQRAHYPMTYECEIQSGDLAGLVRPDDLVGVHREFGLRKVWRGTVKEDKHVSD